MKRLLALAVALLSTPSFAQQYRFPIELPPSGETQPYVTAYRDLDSGGGLLDWNCGSKTYGGHKGTDLGIGSFPVMDAGSRWVVAAADGKVVFVNDGCFDRCTTGDCGCGSGFGNYVKLEHADGKSTYYAHLMMGSISVSLGEQVTCGQHLGKVGSSGNSTGPHLHFEPRYSDNSSDDPFSGPCGGPTSFWVSQGAYLGLPAEQCEEPPTPDVDDAALVGASLPKGSVIEAGQSFEQSFTLKNTGNTTWTKAGSYLLTHDGEETFSAPSQIELGDGESIAPDAEKTWTLSLTAPTTPGTHRGYFRMDHYGIARFGPQLEIEIVVPEPASGSGGAPSGGSGGWSAGGGATGGTPSGGASGGQKSQVIGEEDSGCGCRVGGSSQRGSSLALIAGVLALGLRRRRRA